MLRRAPTGNVYPAWAATTFEFRTEIFARTVKNYTEIFAIARHIVKGIRQLFMRGDTPFQIAAAGMERHLQNALAALHPDAAIPVRIIFKLNHRHASTSSLISPDNFHKLNGKTTSTFPGRTRNRQRTGPRAFAR